MKNPLKDLEEKVKKLADDAEQNLKDLEQLLKKDEEEKGVEEMIKCKKCGSLLVAQDEAIDEYYCTECGERWPAKSGGHPPYY